MRLDLSVGEAVSAFRVLDDECHRPLAPAIVFHADHRRFGYAAALRDQIFDLQRRYPFTAGLDHVLNAIGYLYVAIGRQYGDVAGMQIAAGPQLFRAFRIVEVTLREPGRAQHDLAGGLAVVRNVVHVRVDYPQIDQRRAHACPSADFDLPFGIAAEIGGPDGSNNGNRTSLR